MNYKCQSCFKEFKTKHNHDKHYEFCKFQIYRNSEVLNEIDNCKQEIPNMREMFNFVTLLSLKVNKLEEDNLKLKQYINSKLIKIDPIEWLNENKKPITDFEYWYKSINTYPYLLTVLNNNLKDGVVECISSNSNHNSPLHSFDNKQLKFYIYTNSEWRLITDDELKTFINYIANRFIVDFNNYITDNMNLLNDDNYSNYQEKVYGESDISKRNNKILLQLWNKTKLSVSSVTIK